MKLLTLIGAGVAAGYCYKKVKNRKKNTKSNDFREIEEQAKAQNITV